MTKEEVKRIAHALGADLCGVAPIDRFEDAPQGYHPRDVLPDCQSVISLGIRFPVLALKSPSPVPYTRIRNSITAKMDALALDLCIEMEKRGVSALPIPTNESQWDARTGRWRSIVSQKHAAQAAGLGTIGRHTLLITPQFGSMVWLGAVLTNVALEGDPLQENLCNGCNRCVQVCPVHALDEAQINQQACWDYAFGTDEETKKWAISCHRCRDACPFNFGTENAL